MEEQRSPFEACGLEAMGQSAAPGWVWEPKAREGVDSSMVVSSYGSTAPVWAWLFRFTLSASVSSRVVREKPGTWAQKDLTSGST